MTVKIGDSVPGGSLKESTGFDGVCALAPEPVDIAAAVSGKKIIVFGLPGAFTPTCSASHVPGYLEQFETFKAKGVDEIWCVAVNDAFVMAAWGANQSALGKIRFLGDGSADWALALGLENDLTVAGMGMRMKRFSMLLEDGVVTQLNVEQGRAFEVSDAATMLGQLG
ncbi:MAG: peroxiredoxin [Magnetospiraceae bacterium]